MALVFAGRGTQCDRGQQVIPLPGSAQTKPTNQRPFVKTLSPGIVVDVGIAYILHTQPHIHGPATAPILERARQSDGLGCTSVVRHKIYRKVSAKLPDQPGFSGGSKTRQ